jgi:putative chitinase
MRGPSRSGLTNIFRPPHGSRRGVGRRGALAGSGTAGCVATAEPAIIEEFDYFLAAPNSVKHSEQKENKLWTKVNQAPTIANHPRRRGMSPINRSFFFTQARRTMFSNNLRQSQVDGINAILDGWEAKYAVDDDRWLAYALATTYHETDQHMQPIEEYGKGRGLPYGKVDPTTGQVYYGRGFVQLTWARNYKTMADLLGVDFLNHPALALELDNATKIMFAGMTKGLGNYFNKTTDDWVNARRIINGLDKAQAIAVYGHNFYSAISYTSS